MPEFVVFTPTYNRSDLFFDVVSQIRTEAVAHGLKVLHMVTDDCSDVRHPYEKICSDCAVPGIFDVMYVRNKENYGRLRFWRMWNEMMEKLRWNRFEHFIAIPDDHKLCKDFLRRVRARFLRVKKADTTAEAMNILVNTNMNWGTQRYVDGAFIATRRFFDALNWRIARPGHVKTGKLIRWSNGAAVGSGVGRSMTRFFAKQSKCKIASVSPVSFLTPRKVPSVMFPPTVFPRRRPVWGTAVMNFIDRGKTA